MNDQGNGEGGFSDTVRDSYGLDNGIEPDEDTGFLQHHNPEDTTRHIPSLGSDDLQEGVQKIEAIKKTWTTDSLVIAYLGIFLIAFCTSLEGQTVASLGTYATSSFKKHSLISTVLVVQNVVNSVIKSPMAKVADVFGRFEAFCLCVIIYVAGDIQMALSRNVQTYASAQIFYSAGATGLQILQQVFIADSSSLLNRALLANLPDTPFLVTVWIGPMIGAAILKYAIWRWGYGMWIIILPLAFSPLGLTLYINQRKAERFNLVKPKSWLGQSLFSILRHALYELDLFGLTIFSAAVTLILVPLTIAETVEGNWHNGGIIAMIATGFTCLVLFPIWESSRRFAPYPLLSLHLLKQKTALAGCAYAFFYFMAFYFSVQPYMYSYLQVVQGKSVFIAGLVTQTFSFTATVSAITISLGIKMAKRYRIFVITGSFVYSTGLLLMFLCHKGGKSSPLIFFVQTVVGVGGGIAHVPVQLGVQTSANHQEVAAITAIFLTALEMGGAVGSAISGAIWTHSVSKKLLLYLPDASKPEASEIFGSLKKALSFPTGSATRMAIDQAYQETMGMLLICAICAAIPLFPLALLMKDYNLEKEANQSAYCHRRSDERDTLLSSEATQSSYVSPVR